MKWDHLTDEQRRTTRGRVTYTTQCRSPQLCWHCGHFPPCSNCADVRTHEQVADGAVEWTRWPNVKQHPAKHARKPIRRAWRPE